MKERDDDESENISFKHIFSFRRVISNLAKDEKNTTNILKVNKLPLS